MAYLIDTSVLSRLANSADTMYPVADAAITKLFVAKEVLAITAQNLIEFRNVATRPKAVNGLGLTTTEAENKAAIFEASFGLLPESPDIFLEWKVLVTKLGVIGKQVHDARLVAVCQVHRVSHLLTFNLSHFVTLTKPVPGLAIVDPTNV